MLKILPYNPITLNFKRSYKNNTQPPIQKQMPESKNDYFEAYDINKQLIDNAQQYFLKHYGIDARFCDISQAKLLKEAIDSFIPFSDKCEGGGKLFDGLEVRCTKLNKGNYAIVQRHFSCVDKNDKEAIKKYNIDPNDKETIDFMGKYLVITGQTLYFNTDSEITDEIIEKDYQSGYHSVNSKKGYVIHELAHWLHYNNSPVEAFWTNEKDPDEKEKEIMKSVSRYAAKNFDEFIAEYISGRIEGQEYSKEAYELYKSLNAPKLFN